MSSFNLEQTQIKLKFWSAKVILLSELSHVWSKSYDKNNLKTFAEASEKRRHQHTRKSPEIQFKEFSLTKQKTRPIRTTRELGKLFQKKNQLKNKKTVN